MQDTNNKVYINDPCEYNNEEIHLIVLSNVVKMFINRNVIDSNKNIDKILIPKSNDEYEIKIDSKMIDGSQNILIKIIDQNIQTFNKQSPLATFLSKHIHFHIILIIKNINAKIKDLLLSRYANIEIFLESEMMSCLLDYDLIPEHTLLSEEEKNKVLEEYNTDEKKKKLPKIYVNDPVARYFHASVGQIFRITRYSKSTGYSFTYRYVVSTKK